MSNRIHLEDVPSSDSWTLSDLPIDQLDLLVSEAKAAADEATATLKKLDAAVAIRFNDAAADARRDEGKDTGTVRLGVGDYEVVANLPKKVRWDQNKLPDLLDQLPASVTKGLVKVEIKIDEREYLKLPDHHKAALMAARTVETGKPTFEIKLLAEA
jgi:hypothetical protein